MLNLGRVLLRKSQFLWVFVDFPYFTLTLIWKITQNHQNLWFLLVFLKFTLQVQHDESNREAGRQNQKKKTTLRGRKKPYYIMHDEKSAIFIPIELKFGQNWGMAQPPAHELTRAELSNDAQADFYFPRPCVTPTSARPGARKFRKFRGKQRSTVWRPGSQEYFAALETWIKKRTHMQGVHFV